MTSSEYWWINFPLYLLFHFYLQHRKCSNWNCNPPFFSPNVKLLIFHSQWFTILYDNLFLSKWWVKNWYEIIRRIWSGNRSRNCTLVMTSVPFTIKFFRTEQNFARKYNITTLLLTSWLIMLYWVRQRYLSKHPHCHNLHCKILK